MNSSILYLDGFDAYKRPFTVRFKEGILILGIVIADDEKKICRLIEYLIDWNEIGVELLGVAYDGLSAFKLIQEKKPDILLTDIRMPGMDGLELIGEVKKLDPALKCIIISGYKDFEYAQQGLRFGVKDYLLKPINQDELLHSIRKIVDEVAKQKDSQNTKVEMEEKIRNYSEELKRVFLRTVLNQKMGADMAVVLDAVHQKNVNDFIPDYGRCILIRPDINYKNFTGSSYQLLIDKTTEIIRTEFLESEMEILLETSEEGIFTMILGKSLIRTQILKSCNRIRERVIGLRDLFPEIKVTIIVSAIADSVEEMAKQIYKTRETIYERIFLENNQIVELNRGAENEKCKVNIAAEMDKILTTQDETFEIDNIQECLQEAEKRMILIHAGGREVREGTEILLNYFIERMKKMDASIDFRQKIYEFEERYEHCSNLDEVFELLHLKVTQMLEEALKNLKNREIKPIKYAKQYIEENKGKNISLEELAKTVGFSYTYFSSLFKKETGKTLTEYIQQVRIEAAKKLLVQKDKKVNEVAEMVGYSDIKFFTKQFKKSVGVSPNEFHKMFCEK